MYKTLNLLEHNQSKSKCGKNNILLPDNSLFCRTGYKAIKYIFYEMKKYVGIGR